MKLHHAFKEWSFSSAESKWLFAFIVTSVVNHGLMASLGTVLGPTRPYLEQIFSTDSTTFSLLWAVHGTAYLLGVFVSTWTFHRYILNTKYNASNYK